jgi:2-iminobutanoate/2-iminopropanoate deaminase
VLGATALVAAGLAIGVAFAPRAAEYRQRAISSPDAPPAIGPYSAGVLVPPGKLLFLSGQLPLDSTGTMVTGDITVLTHQVMQNLGHVLAAGRASFDDVVKCTIYVTNLGDFAAINGVYGSYFGAVPPARATVQVAALPRGSSVEIECLAVLP